MTMSVREALNTRFGEATVVDAPNPDAEVVLRTFMQTNPPLANLMPKLRSNPRIVLSISLRWRTN